MPLFGEKTDDIKDTLYACDRATSSREDSISPVANLINMGPLCKTPEEVGIREETPLGRQSISA